MKLGLREANQQFSKAIRAVRAGKEVILTERGHPIAVIKPIKDDDSVDVSIQAMVDEGFLKPATRKGRTPTPRWRPTKIKGQPLSQTVLDDREDRA
jgi:prevent-host-death family protein